MSKVNQAISSSVKKLLNGVGVKTCSYSELAPKVKGFTLENETEVLEKMSTQKALHLVNEKLIAVDDEDLASTEDANELVLHELIHLTAPILKRYYEGEIGEQTEECVAQIGMFKLTLVLGLNPAPYADKTLEYIKQFPKVNFKRVEIDSDRAVEYLVKFVGLEKVA